MFGIKELKTRVTLLENRLRKREIDEACAAGKHEWEMKEDTTCCGENKKPWIRCIHCWKLPETLITKEKAK